MGTNFYLSKEHSEKYVLPKLLNWLSKRANEVITSNENHRTRNEFSVLKWFDELANTCNDSDYLRCRDSLVMFASENNPERKNLISIALDSLDQQHERALEDDYQAFYDNVRRAVNKKQPITPADFEPIKNLIFTNIICEDCDGAHIGKRSAAGDFCFNCNTTMCKGGKENVHYDGHDWHKVCPICGCKPEYTYSFSFQWSKDLWKEVFKEAKELDIYDEYDEHFTKEQFLNEELEKAKKACPENMWDYQLFYEDERRFS